jgi:hypothetical protein
MSIARVIMISDGSGSGGVATEPTIIEVPNPDRLGQNIPTDDQTGCESYQ